MVDACFSTNVRLLRSHTANNPSLINSFLLFRDGTSIRTFRNLCGSHQNSMATVYYNRRPRRGHTLIAENGTK